MDDFKHVPDKYGMFDHKTATPGHMECLAFKLEDDRVTSVVYGLSSSSHFYYLRDVVKASYPLVSAASGKDSQGVEEFVQYFESKLWGARFTTSIDDGTVNYMIKLYLK